MPGHAEWPPTNAMENVWVLSLGHCIELILVVNTELLTAYPAKPVPQCRSTH